MKNFRIETTGEGTIEVYTPYNETFVKKLKRIGNHQWNNDKKCWILQENTIAEVRKIMNDVYGENDTSPEEYVSVKLSFSEDYTNRTPSIQMFSRIIASARSRDVVGNISSGVVYTSGEYYTGGSSKHPKVTIKGGSEIVIKNVPCQLARNEEIPESVQVKIDDENIDRKALILERTKLQNRIEEIDKLLKKTAEMEN